MARTHIMIPFSSIEKNVNGTFLDESCTFDSKTCHAGLRLRDNGYVCYPGVSILDIREEHNKKERKLTNNVSDLEWCLDSMKSEKGRAVWMESGSKVECGLMSVDPNIVPMNAWEKDSDSVLCIPVKNGRH